MKDEKIPITNDYIFKKIFSKKGNEDILKDLLIGILEIPIEKIEVQAEVSLEKELIEIKEKSKYKVRISTVNEIKTSDNKIYPENLLSMDSYISEKHDMVKVLSLTKNR